MEDALTHGPVVAGPRGGDWAVEYTVWWVGRRLTQEVSLPDWFRVVWVRDYLRWDGHDFGGLAFAPGGIIVLESPSGLVSKTALVHEVLHVLLWHTTGSIDHDHESAWWACVSEINSEIAALGW